MKARIQSNEFIKIKVLGENNQPKKVKQNKTKPPPQQQQQQKIDKQTKKTYFQR